MPKIDWDRFLDPPDEKEVKVAECAACGNDLLAGDKVYHERTTNAYLCFENECFCRFDKPVGMDLEVKVLDFPDEEPEPYRPETETANWEDDDN